MKKALTPDRALTISATSPPAPATQSGWSSWAIGCSVLAASNATTRESLAGTRGLTDAVGLHHFDQRYLAMNQPGIGAMLHYLGGGSKHNPSDFYGRKIVGAELRKADDGKSRWDHDGHDAIVLKFEDGTGMALWDDGQSCCENRYITCDDDLSKLVGGTLTRIEPKEAKDTEKEYGECHEQVFIEIGTNECFVTLCTHNEHNGYYGGFGLTLDELKASTDPV